jgi:hypothetical protein
MQINKKVLSFIKTLQEACMDNEELEIIFTNEMNNIYEQARVRCNYNATRFLLMIKRFGGLETAKQLLNNVSAQSGFAELCLCECIDLTMENLVLKPEYQALFDEHEIQEARRRLVT